MLYDELEKQIMETYNSHVECHSIGLLAKHQFRDGIYDK